MNTSSDKPTPDCLSRARRLLFGMALLAIVAVAWSIAITDMKEAKELVRPLLNALIPLALIQMIWMGRNWSRFALAAYCLFVLWDSFGSFAATRPLMEKGEYAQAAFFVLVFVGHAAIGAAALFAKSITELIEYRKEQSEAEEAE